MNQKNLKKKDSINYQQNNNNTDELGTEIYYKKSGDMIEKLLQEKKILLQKINHISQEYENILQENENSLRENNNISKEYKDILEKNENLKKIIIQQKKDHKQLQKCIKNTSQNNDNSECRLI